MVTRGYRGLKKGLKGNAGGYKKLQRIYGGYKV